MIEQAEVKSQHLAGATQAELQEYLDAIGAVIAAHHEEIAAAERKRSMVLDVAGHRGIELRTEANG